LEDGGEGVQLHLVVGDAEEADGGEGGLLGGGGGEEGLEDAGEGEVGDAVDIKNL